MSIVDILSFESGLETALVERIIRNAPIRYKTYQIPKRSGGFRTISQPAREVKVLQRALSEVLLRRLPVHEAATAYRPGISIKDNALRHVGDGPILKMDFKDFFPSIKPHDWAQYCKETGALTDLADVRLTTLLLFQRPKGSRVLRLAIGAPSSPFVSNALLYEFDKRITGEVARLEYPKLLINTQKTTRITRKYGRRVTGLTLTNDGRVSIGHERKRILHAQVHSAAKDLLDSDQIAELKGMLGFVNSVEPQFLDVLRRRYGHSIITTIQRFEPPPPPLDSLE
ncbi:MAG: RNA-directed DNA polymerase [Mesorhizobium sp.]|uniref:reverse transcriptase domain-containing protein n=1 Tax=Mesorhizobium sp. TaxID=1871066 RepID=UPI0011F9331B|nr:reverse transcriptase domain-containing protein [Mesorhizobium sp.]TIQ28390.1 MAG: RNA-directed DNA polymerase [Mesorhizobium sp.]